MNPKRILITGAATGIGAATARLAARRGWSVCVHYRQSEHEAQDLLEEILDMGGDAFSHPADLTREEEIHDLFRAIDGQWGQLDGLVNNTGMLETQTRLENITLNRLQRVFATNVFGTILCCREALRRMSTSHHGRGGAIVNVSSAATKWGGAGEYIDYAASKGAIDTLTRGLAAEVASEGIRVNAVNPAFIHTRIHALGGEPERIARLQPKIPMGRGGTPEEVAEAIVWLLSEEASYVTGAHLEMAGGL